MKRLLASIATASLVLIPMSADAGENYSSLQNNNRIENFEESNSRVMERETKKREILQESNNSDDYDIKRRARPDLELMEAQEELEEMHECWALYLSTDCSD